MIVTFAISGCSNTDNAANEKDKIVNQLDPTREQAPGNQELNDKLGYVRYTKDQLNNEQEQNHIVTIDRIKMADMITRVILRNEVFEEVATLVTDQEVLIAYRVSKDENQNNTANIARETAKSVMPRYFDIYVSDNEVLINDLHSLHNSSTQNKNYQNTIDQIIKEMKKPSQELEKNTEK